MRGMTGGKAVLALFVLAAVVPSYAQEPELAPMTEQMLLDRLPEGARVEVRLDADLNGDQVTDTAFIGGTEDKRVLQVMVGYKDEFDWGHAPVGEVELEVTPLGAAALSVKKDVLLVEDLTGGTTATAATYRYRYDAKQKRMRLIGLDAERYSRTNSHDSIKMSWNLLSGDRIIQVGHVDESGQGDAAYRYEPERKVSNRIAPVYLEDTPNPDSLLEADLAQ